MAQKIKKISEKCIAFICMITLMFSYSVVGVNESDAALASVSDTLTDSRFNTASDHTIAFTVKHSSLVATDTIVVAFEADFDTSSVVFADITIADDTDSYTVDDGACASNEIGITGEGTDTVTFTLCTGTTIADEEPLTITFANEHITNPATAVCGTVNDSYICKIDVTTSDESGTTKVAIISGVAVSATVDETLTFTIAGVANSTTQKASVTTTVDTSGDATTLPLGTLSVSANTIAGQNLTVSTNATGGYTTTLEYTAALTSGSDTIDDWTGSNAAPTAFPAAGTDEAWGYTTDDAVLGTGTTGRFGTNNVWAALTTSPLEVAYSNVPVSSEVTKMAYQAAIEGTTEAGSYTTTLFYITTPIY